MWRGGGGGRPSRTESYRIARARRAQPIPLPIYPPCPACVRVRVRVNRLAPRLPPLHRWVCDESKRLHQLVPPALAAEAEAAAKAAREAMDED